MRLNLFAFKGVNKRILPGEYTAPPAHGPNFTFEC